MIKNYREPQSSFMSVEKDLTIITDKMIQDKRLKKLLYYTTKDALKHKDLTEEQTLQVLLNNIKIVPKLYVDGSVLAYIIISFDNFVTNAENPQFRDNIVTFDIICHFDQWQLEDFQLRPYRIAAEIDTLFNKLESLFEDDAVTKEDVVRVIRDYLPNFEHEEKGKNLDQRM